MPRLNGGVVLRMMSNNYYKFTLQRNDRTVIIEGNYDFYNITISDSVNEEHYRVAEILQGKYRIGKLVSSGNDTAGIGVDYNVATDSFNIVWPNEGIFKEVVKIIEIMKESTTRISKCMDEDNWC